MGLYSTRSGPILRRAWPARGMVVDPGIHLFGWTREEAIEFMSEAGRFSDYAEIVVRALGASSKTWVARKRTSALTGFR